MSRSTLLRRLEVLEARRSPTVYAIPFDGEEQVEVCGIGERMTRAAFDCRYQDSLIVLRLAEELWAAL